MFNYKPYIYTNLVIFYLLLLVFSPQNLFAQETRDDQDAPVIRVALGLDLKDAEVSLPSGGTVFDPVEFKEIISYTKSTKIKLALKSGKISASGINGTFSKIQIIPGSGAKVGYGGKQYRGKIRVTAKKSGLWVINDVGIEDYLYGVVPFEVPMSWNIEAIKAQAVAARTYAVRCLNQYSHGEFDVYDSVKDQVYGGVDGEKPNSLLAVDGTRGIILSYQGWPIKAYYCADAGGQTEYSKFVFTSDLPYLKSVPSMDNLEKHRWHFLISKKELAELFKSCGHKLGEIKDLVITSVSPSGRPRAIKVIGSSGSHEFSSNDFRKMIGAGRVRSTLFTIVNHKGTSGLTGTEITVRTVSINQEKEKSKCIGSNGTIEIGDKEISIRGGKSTVNCTLVGKSAITASLGNIYVPKEDVKPSEDEFLFAGSGFGHGVGMSQWGAKACAESGWDYKQILLHYYSGAELTVWY